MKITNIDIKHFRLLNDFTITIEENLSLVIGKNNTGKTSLLHILQKFIASSSNSFNFDDFSIRQQATIIKAVEKEIPENKYTHLNLELLIEIEYENDDSLENISDLILDLDPQNNKLKLLFEYRLDYNDYTKLRNDYENHEFGKDLIDFLKKHHKAYFKISRKVIDANDDSIFIEIEHSKIQKIINIQTISAKRDVMNDDGDGANNKTLSKLSYRYYKPFENSQAEHVVALQHELIKADKNLTKSYKDIFEKVTKDIKRFSYNNSKISVKSNFEEVSLIRENTSVVYNEDGFLLPEDYNGLGYMNLFSMIFELHIIFDDFKKSHQESNPSEINLLFIEEPEAHTHPQMQYVFIQNIKTFLDDNRDDINLQTIITTHSAHIISQSNFSDIKYFLKKEQNVTSKNLADLKKLYDTDEKKANFKFLKQYLTLHKSELFFSDKIIFIEGDTERILLPAMMKKLDLENIKTKEYIPLLSQNISIVEVGANSKVFDEFLSFLEIKTLIITDIDSVKTSINGSSCPVDEGSHTSNSSIRHFIKRDELNALKELKEDKKILSKTDKGWVRNVDGQIYIAYQIKENDYHARSFEDAFISLNIDFLKENKDDFDSLKWKDKFDNVTPNFYDIANTCIKKKTGFATDILFYSEKDFTNWNTPNYIKKGLLWLVKN